MKRIVFPVLAAATFAACEPTQAPDPSSGTRFSDPGLQNDGDEIPPQQYFEEEAPPPAIDEPPVDDPWVDDTQTLTLRSGFLRGSVGPVVDLSNNATSLDGSSMDGWTTVHTTVLEGPRIAMTIVELMGDVDAFERGHTYRYDYSGYSEEDPGAPWLSVVGCSAADDPDEGFDFDESAEEVAITVDEDTPDELNVQYDARFVQWDEYGRPAGETVVHGRFVWLR